MTENSRCRHLFPKGRRCRAIRSSNSKHFCRRHAYLPTPPDVPIDVSREIVGNIEEFTSAADINKVLSRILLLLAQDRITPRRAKVMAYTCHLLLRTITAIDKEDCAEANEAVKIPKAFDWWHTPGPDGITPRERRAKEAAIIAASAAIDAAKAAAASAAANPTESPQESATVHDGDDTTIRGPSFQKSHQIA